MKHTIWLAVAALVGVVGCAGPFGPPHAARSPASSRPLQATARYQMGIDFDFYWYKNMKVAQAFTADAGYAKSLGANAVSIAFPLCACGSTAAAGPSTPPPAVLGQAISAARSAGLAVYLRPLVSQGNQAPSRVQWQPARLAEWFRSYQAFLLPYARLAQHTGVAGFYVGTELSQFAHSGNWAALDAALGHVYHGPLYYSANWSDVDKGTLAGSGGPPATVTVDAYQPMPVPPAGFGASWTDWTRRLPQGTVLSEVGIVTRAGAQDRPYSWAPTGEPLDPQVQPAWFTAACRAVHAGHLGGIYFWSISVGQRLDVASAKASYSFVDSPGAAAIKGCFSRLAGA
ncbi:MAG TPA: hypothetical protein VHZ03_38765 [Trebonia sp.]|nr:hypothetical protein [Trebonia sp.]